MKKILIVDDVSINRKILKKTLILNYEILEASNGVEAFKILENDTNNLPSIILLDLMMPLMDGYEFLRMIKKNELLKPYLSLLLLKNKIKIVNLKHYL